MNADPQALQYLENARQALRARDRRTARRWAERAAALAPELVEAWLILAALASPKASISHLQRALRLDPTNPQAQAGMIWAQNRLMAEQGKQAGEVTLPHRVPVRRPVVHPQQSRGAGTTKQRWYSSHPSRSWYLMRRCPRPRPWKPPSPSGASSPGRRFPPLPKSRKNRRNASPRWRWLTRVSWYSWLACLDWRCCLAGRRGLPSPRCSPPRRHPCRARRRGYPQADLHLHTHQHLHPDRHAHADRHLHAHPDRDADAHRHEHPAADLDAAPDEPPAADQHPLPTRQRRQVD